MRVSNLNGANETDQAQALRRIEAERTSGHLPSGVQHAEHGTTAASDSISVSDRAAHVAKLVEIAKASPDVRADRVAELRHRVESGTFEPRAEDIADAILRHES